MVVVIDHNVHFPALFAMGTVSLSLHGILWTAQVYQVHLGSTANIRASFPRDRRPSSAIFNTGPSTAWLWCYRCAPGLHSLVPWWSSVVTGILSARFSSHSALDRHAWTCNMCPPASLLLRFHRVPVERMGPLTQLYLIALSRQENPFTDCPLFRASCGTRVVLLDQPFQAVIPTKNLPIYFNHYKR